MESARYSGYTSARVLDKHPMEKTMRPHHVDHERCDLCGLCVTICGRGIYEEKDRRMEYFPGERCIDCGHCAAICPCDALVFEDETLPPEIKRDDLPAADGLLHFFRARRSTRRFKKEIPPRELLEKLVDAARYAPTGTNRQAVKLSVVTDQDLIARLRTAVMDRYAAYERHLANPVKRFFLRTLVDRRLGNPGLRAFLKSFMDGWRGGRDVLFHEAPVVVLVSNGPEASTPRDDCCIALHQMTLYAERLGLGSCLLGTVEAAFGKVPELNDLIGLPRTQRVMAVACFGYPAVRFKRLTERKAIDVQWI